LRLSWAMISPSSASWRRAMCTFVIVGQNCEALIGNRDIVALLSSYIGLPLFLALWAGHKLVTREPAVHPEEAGLTR
jgi:lysine-specific permease